MHLDGFRFDLASIFTRKEDGSLNLDDPPIIAEISSASDMNDVRLIAEAWDAGTYELGRSFPGISWLQWNGGVAGAPDLSVDSHSFAWYLDGASQQDADVYVMVNATLFGRR